MIGIVAWTLFAMIHDPTASPGFAFVVNMGSLPG